MYITNTPNILDHYCLYSLIETQFNHQDLTAKIRHELNACFFVVWVSTGIAFFSHSLKFIHNFVQYKIEVLLCSNFFIGISYMGWCLFVQLSIIHFWLWSLAGFQEKLGNVRNWCMNMILAAIDIIVLYFGCYFARNEVGIVVKSVQTFFSFYQNEFTTQGAIPNHNHYPLHCTEIALSISLNCH